MKEVKILEVHVDKGMKHGQKITFGGEADQAPGVEPGDIVLVLQEKENEVSRPVAQYCSHIYHTELNSLCCLHHRGLFVLNEDTLLLLL